MSAYSVEVGLNSGALGLRLEVVGSDVVGGIPGSEIRTILGCANAGVVFPLTGLTPVRCPTVSAEVTPS